MFLRFAALAALALAPSQAMATWYEAKTNHFIIYSQQKPEALRKYATELERFDSGVRAVRQMKDPPPTSTSRLTLYTLRDWQDVSNITGIGGIAGVYFGRVSGPVSFANSQPKRGRWDLDGRTVFFHEYLHHLMLQDATAAYPTWMVEGYAEFFAPAELLADGSVEFGEPPHYRGAWLRLLRGMTLPDMLGSIYHQTTDEEWISQYSSGWLLAHYLAFEPSRRGQVSKYVDLIQKGVPALDSAKQAFGDLKKLEKELSAYRGRDTLPTRIIPASMIKVGPVQVRALEEDEEAILPVRMKLEAQMDNSGTARTLVGGARSAAKRFPRSPIVAEVLAQAELQAKNYEEANLAADQALALNQRAVKPLIYKGRAQLELAKKNPQSANWQAIRTWFSKANRLDTSSPEPLMYYYETYVAQGVAPPAQAVDGLLYAVDLVPQDDELRLTAVRQLLRDNAVADARAAFAPIAYSPHFPKERRRNLEIMDKIKGGDGTGALVMLEEDEKKRLKAKR
jgi:tetratricopeptide (TPR) repeat protein